MVTLAVVRKGIKGRTVAFNHFLVIREEKGGEEGAVSLSPIETAAFKYLRSQL